MDRSATVGLDEKVAFLERPESYPHDPPDVEAVETHMAWVFLAGEEAYKLKKPVRYEYLDFSTLDARRRDCHAEVRLNRRLAPDVYRGVEALRWTPPGGLSVDSAGDIVEWLVHMRRLPREQMLDVRIGEGDVSAADVRAVVERLVPFYRSVPTVPLSAEEYRTRLRDDVEESRHELERSGVDLPLTRLNALRDGLLGFVSERADLLDARVREGRIVEGHGDLRPEHICLEDGPVIIDCLEFNFDFRTVDPADDLSYLAVECARLGDPELGDSFLDGYRRLSGDETASDLLDFYGSFRSLLRAKIAIWHILDPELGDHHAKWMERTREYLELAQRFLPVV